MPNYFYSIHIHNKHFLKRRKVWLPTLFMYSESRSWRAWRIALHSAMMRSRWKSRVQEESASKAAPLIIASKRFSSDGLILSSLTKRGSWMIKCWKVFLESKGKNSQPTEVATLFFICMNHSDISLLQLPTSSFILMSKIPWTMADPSLLTLATGTDHL